MQTKRLLQLPVVIFFASLSVFAQSTGNSTNIGQPDSASFHGSDIDNVQLNNGNLHIEIPLYSVSGRGLPVTFKYVYDNKGWTADLSLVQGGGPSYIEPLGYNDLSGFGAQPFHNMEWNVAGPLSNPPSAGGIPGLGYSRAMTACTVNGTVQNQAYLTYTYKEPSGASHTFQKVLSSLCGSQPNTYYAIDGSGFMLQLSPFVLIAKDGTRIYPTYNNQSQVNGLVMQDTNGNQLTKAYSPTTGSATSITDTLGRSLSSDFVYNSTSGKYEMTYYDSSGSPRTIGVVKSAVSIQTNLCNFNAGSPCYEYTDTWQMPTEIDLPNGTKYTITYNQNSFGTPASITLPSGATITYTWGTNTAHSCGSSSYGANFNMDDGGPRVIARTISGPDVPTATWSYSYSCKGNSVSGNGRAVVSDAVGNDTAHIFDNTSSSFLSAATKPSYEIETDYYSGSFSSGTLLKTVATDYQALDSSQWIQNPNWSKLPIHTTTTWVAQGNLQQRTETDYDSALKNGATITWGNAVETREYGFGVGAYGALVRKTHLNYAHLSGNTNYNANDVTQNIANRATERQVYDGGGNLTADSKTAYDGNTVTAISGVPNHVTPSTQYRGNATQTQVWRNLPSVAWLPPTNNVFNDLGNLVSTQDPGGHTTTFSYADSWSGTGCGIGTNTQAFLTETDPPTTTNSQNNSVQHRSQTTYYPCTGQKQSSRDENDILAGRTGTTYTYDLMLRPLCVNATDGGQTCFTYGDTANAVSVTTTTKIQTTPSVLNRVEVSNHDSLGRVKNTVLQDSVGPYAEGDITTDTTYDLLGRVASVSNPHRATSSITDGITSYQYDALSRKTQETPPDGPAAGVVTYSYGAQTTGTLGLTTTIADQAAKKRMSVNDALGQLVDVWEQSDSAGTLGWETAYQYDTLGNLKRVDQKGGDANSANWRTRTFTYDSLSRLLTATNPESGQITWTYDSDGNVLTKLDAKGTTITYHYDALHRVATEGATHAKSYSNGDAAVDYYFDQTLYNGLNIFEQVGHQTGMADVTGSSAWSFDSEGRTKTENQTINIAGLTSSAITKSITYNYNLDGSLQYMIYPSGRRVDYQYSTIGRTGSVADTGTGGATYLSWSPPAGTCSSDNQKRYSVHGEELCLNHGNGIVSYNGFNNRFQPSLLSAAGSSGTVLSLSYTFTDANSKNNGLLFKITNNKDTTRSQNFTYDQLNRIQSAWTDGNLWGNDFTIDPWGNLTAKAVHAGKPVGESLTVTASNKNQLNTYSYDNNGNLLNDQLGHSFNFDAENRPYSAGGVTYYYDGLGERDAKSNGKLYWFQSDNSPTAESDTSGNLTLEFIFANGKRLARRDANGTVHYYFSDQINSSNVITSVDGSAIQSESDFYPYGGERVIVADVTGNNYKFTGKERDPETNNDYFGARYYSANFGRFLTPDWASAPQPTPYANLAIPQTLNLYIYVQNNPMTGIDPDGHDPDPCVGSAECAYQQGIANAGKEKKEKPKSAAEAVKYGGYFFGKALNYLAAQGQAPVTAPPAVAATSTFVNGAATSLWKVQYDIATFPLTFGSHAGKVMDGGTVYDKMFASGMEILAGTGLAGYMGAVRGGLTSLTGSTTTQMSWAEMSSMLRAAAGGKGNFGIGSASAADADAMGQAWAGAGARPSSNGSALVSSDGLRVYRGPALKTSGQAAGSVQANFERFTTSETGARVQVGNAHLDIQ